MVDASIQTPVISLKQAAELIGISILAAVVFYKDVVWPAIAWVRSRQERKEREAKGTDQLTNEDMQKNIDGFHDRLIQTVVDAKRESAQAYEGLMELLSKDIAANEKIVFISSELNTAMKAVADGTKILLDRTMRRE